MNGVTMIPYIENQDFAIFGNENFSFLKEDLLTMLSSKKKEILIFFHLPSFPQVKVNLFFNRNLYYDYIDNGKQEENSITVCCEGIPENQMFPFLKRSILHQYTEIVYASIYKNRFSKPFWLSVGIASIFSGEKEKLEKSDFAFRNFYLDKIVRRDKKVPYKTFFESEERFVYNKLEEYDRYDISYLLVHYLLEVYPNLYDIITNGEAIKNLEQTILKNCITYYNQKYPVKDNFYAIKNDQELMDYMNKYILYGWLDEEHQQHIDTLKDFRKQYCTSTIEEILNTKIATCIGQAKLMQYWFQLMGIENKLFCIRNIDSEQDTENIKMHCFVLFHYQDAWYHFEHNAIRKRGIYKFATLEEAIEKTAMKFLKEYDLKELTEIPTIPDGITYEEFNQYVSSFPRYEVDKGKTK